MKKLFTLAALAVAALSAQAKDYTDVLKVVVNGGAMPEKKTTVSIDQNADQTYKLSLNNLTLTDDGVTLGVGNIVVDNVAGATEGDVTTLEANRTIQITAGDIPGLAWTGPMLGDVPIDMRAEIRGEKLYFIIDIDMMEKMKQVINVQFGDGGYQIGNAGFESFHTATFVDGENKYSSDEPDSWHSFNSGVTKGEGFMAMLLKLALYNGSTSKSTDVRPGSTGDSSVVIKSSVVAGITANGTMTTGRMQAGNMDAKNAANCAFLDMSKTDLDDNGDPFYTVLNGQPDSLAVWVKFKQGQVVEDYPYANVSAVITDGTYYQDPEDKEYTNVVAKAQDKKVESKDAAWQRLSIPFDYDTYSANNAEAKALLVTISTNAEPGAGSKDENNPDSVWVDDIELIYNSTVTGISLRGEALAGFEADSTEYWATIKNGSTDVKADEVAVTTDAKGMKVSVSSVDVDCIGGGSDITVTAMGGDLKNRKTYVIHTRSEEFMTGIGEVEAEGDTVEAVYNLSGQRVETPVKGQVYITKYANGKTVKTIKK